MKHIFKLSELYKHALGKWPLQTAGLSSAFMASSSDYIVQIFIERKEYCCNKGNEA